MKTYRMPKALRDSIGDPSIATELEALQNIVVALGPLDQHARARVLLVVAARLGDVLTEQQMQNLLRLAIEPRQPLASTRTDT
jgi:hypothetical protein